MLNRAISVIIMVLQASLLDGLPDSLHMTTALHGDGVNCIGKGYEARWR